MHDYQREKDGYPDMADYRQSDDAMTLAELREREQTETGESNVLEDNPGF